MYNNVILNYKRESDYIMLKDKALPFSIICLSISIIISAIIIANGMRSNGDYVGTGLSDMSQGLSNIVNNMYNNNANVVYTRNTYDLSTASSYLGIEESKLLDIVNEKDSGIPYIKIGNDYIFSKSALDKWLETARVEIK